MQFSADATSYDRFMGRYTPSLAVGLADVADVRDGHRVLDVGCGPGGLTRELCKRVGPEAVAAVDPAPQFVAACRDRNPGADVREGSAEDLPWSDGEFDVVLASLVVGFMADPVRGVAEMTRVARPGGTVTACMWDIAGGGMTMLATFWSAARAVHPDVAGEHSLPGTAEGDLVRRFERAGLSDVTGGALTARADYAGFDDFWDPFRYGVGPAGGYLVRLPADEQEQVRAACRRTVADQPFTLEARAWYARGTRPTR